MAVRFTRFQIDLSDWTQISGLWWRRQDIHVHLVNKAAHTTILCRLELVLDAVPQVDAIFALGFPKKQKIIFEVCQFV